MVDQAKVILCYIWHLNKIRNIIFSQLVENENKMEDLKIFGVYGLNLGALAFSFSEINPFVQFLVLVSTLTFTIIQIYKALKK